MSISPSIAILLSFLTGALGALVYIYVFRKKSLGAQGNGVLEERLEGKEREIRDLRNRENDLQTKLEKAALEIAQLKSTQGDLEARLSVLKEEEDQLANRFKTLSTEVLKQSNDSFLQLAKSTLGKYQEESKGDLEKRQLAIEQMVKPVKESLEKVDQKIHELEKTREGSLSIFNHSGEVSARDSKSLKR